MKKTKRIFIKMLVLFTICMCLFPIVSNAELTMAQREKVANFAKAFVTKGNEKGILRYQMSSKRNIGFNNTLSSDGLMYFDCSSFACFVYNQTCNAGLDALTTSTLISSSKFNHVGTYNGNTNNLLPGDLIDKPGKHVVVYIGNGQIAHASTDKAAATKQVKVNNLSSHYNGYTILRYNGTPSTVKGFESYVWPDGTTSQWKDEQVEDFEFQGSQNGTFGVQDFGFHWILNKLADILDWYIGIVSYIVRAVFVGWASVIETLINNVMEWTTGEEASLTIEKLVNNKVPIFDVNFFDLETIGGEKLEKDSIMYVIRENIAIWYYIIRTISIIGLLITLIYLGIRMALATVGEQKSKYKELLVSWLTSFLIVLFIHYIMIIILNINNSLIELINVSLGGGEESLYDSVRSSAYAIQISVGLPGLIMYLSLIYLLIRFLFMYFKRFLVVAILTCMAPIIGVTYSIDKIKDNKSQSLGNWLREYTFNVIIQSVHALLYTLLVGLAFEMAGNSVAGAIIALLLMNFILKAEVIFKKIFGIKSGSMKDVLKSTLAIATTASIAKKVIKTNSKMLGVVAKPVTSTVKDISARTKQYKRSDKVEQTRKAIENAKKTGNTNISVGKYNFDIGELLKEDENLNSKELANNLVSKYEKLNKANKEYMKNAMSETLNTIGGGVQLLASVPMMVIDGEEGTALALNARKKLKNGIKADKELNRKYTGKYSGIKDLMTAGLYSKAKIIRGKNADYLKKLDNSTQDTQYEIAMKKLEKKIEKSVEKLEKLVDKQELEKVLKSAFASISTEDVENVLYKIQGYRNAEIRAKVNIDIETVETEEKLQKVAKDSSNIQEICKNIEAYNVCKYTINAKEVEVNNKDFNDVSIEIEKAKFKKALEKEVSKFILADKNEGKGKKAKDISKEEIDKTLKSVDNNEKTILIEKAIKDSIDKKSNISLKAQVDKIVEESKDMDKMFLNLKKMNKGKDVKIDEGKFKAEIQSQLITKVSKELGIRKKDVTNLEVEELFKEMKIEDRQEMVEKALYKTIEIQEEAKEKLKKEKTKMGLEDVETIISKMKANKVQEKSYKENFEDIVRTNIEKEWNIKEENITTETVNEYIAELTNEELITAIKTAGAKRTSLKRDKNAEKDEYKEILDDIEKLNYYKAQMKG